MGTLHPQSGLTPRSADTHDNLQHEGHSEDLAELMRELDSVFCPRSVERRVEECLASGVVWQASCERRVRARRGWDTLSRTEGRDILVTVCRAEEEHVDRNLCARALDCGCLVERRRSREA